MSLGPGEYMNGYVLRDSQGRRQFVIHPLNGPLALNDVDANTGVFDNDGREQVVFRVPPNTGTGTFGFNGLTGALEPVGVNTARVQMTNGQTSDPWRITEFDGDILAHVDFLGIAYFNALAIGPAVGVPSQATVSTDAGTTLGLVVRGAVAQSANLQQWQDSTGAVLARVDNAGFGYFGAAGIGVYGGGSPATLGIASIDPAVTAVNVRLAVAQTANALTIENSAGADLWTVSADGIPKWDQAAANQTTIGSAGGAAALPATPRRYLRVRDTLGNVLAIPAYNAV